MSAEKKVCEILFQGRELIISKIVNELVQRNNHGFSLNEDELNRVQNVVRGCVDASVNALSDQVIRLDLDAPKVTKQPKTTTSSAKIAPKKSIKKK